MASTSGVTSPPMCTSTTAALRSSSEKTGRAAGTFTTPLSSIHTSVAEAVAARLGEKRQAVGPGAHGDGVHEPARGGVDHVHDAVIATRQPEPRAVGAHTPHVRAAAHVPGGSDLAGAEVQDRDT